MKKWLENQRIEKKLTAGFLIIAILCVIVGVVGVINMLRMSKDQQDAYELQTMGIVYSANAEISFKETQTTLRDLYIDYGIGSEKGSIEQLNAQMAKVEEMMAGYATTITSDEGQQLYEETMTAYHNYADAVNEALKAVQEGKSQAQILAQIKRGGISAAETTAAFSTLAERKMENAESGIQSSRVTATVSILIVAVIAAAAFVVALLLGRLISRSISKPLQMLSKVSQHLAVGDMDIYGILTEEDQHVKDRKDEVGEVALSYNRLIAGTLQLSRELEMVASGDLTTQVTIRSEKDVMGKALVDLVTKFRVLATSIVTSSSEVDAGARQVADSSTALSQGATEQASAVEELSASMQEVTAQTTQNADNARKTNELTGSIQRDADSGNERMTEMLRAMDDINESSQSIGKIIKVIEDIAFQTNILALNAAIEAARAGNAGKGFAVVADEVRNLAGKSAQAAKETTELIETSINKVLTGTGIAKETADALGKIVEGVSQAGDLVGSIATASNQQAAALEQINQGIVQISQVVQSNAASAEESAAASEELSAQADTLKGYVGVFKLSGDAAGKEETASDGEQPEDFPVQEEPAAEEASHAGHGLVKY